MGLFSYLHLGAKEHKLDVKKDNALWKENDLLLSFDGRRAATTDKMRKELLAFTKDWPDFSHRTGHYPMRLVFHNRD